MIIIGVAFMMAGELWGLHIPIIKKIWTSSMTLFSSGLCFLLMALFYYLVDYKGFGKHLSWLKIYGMNSIVAYMLFMIVNFTSVSKSLLFGLEQYTGPYYPALISLSNACLILLILWILNRQKIYLKV